MFTILTTITLICVSVDYVHKILKMNSKILKGYTLLALITPALSQRRPILRRPLFPPRANFDLPPFRAAFNATIGKNQKNQKKGKFLKVQEQLFRFQSVFFPAE